MPHVQFLGRKDVQDVPSYIAACDVCLLPYRINEWTRNIDSLKLYEYLACGKPVVATDVPAARRFSDVVRVAANEASKRGAAFVRWLLIIVVSVAAVRYLGLVELIKAWL